MARLPKAVRVLGLVDVLQHRERRRAAGKVADVLQDLVPAVLLGRRLHQAHRRDGARVHQRVDRALVLVDLDRQPRVERQAGGLHADLVVQDLRALLGHDERRREGLGHRLDRELVVHVAGRVDLAVPGGDHHAEQLARRLGQDRDVVGVLAFLQALVPRVGRVHEPLAVPSASGRRRSTLVKPSAATASIGEPVLLTFSLLLLLIGRQSECRAEVVLEGDLHAGVVVVPAVLVLAARPRATRRRPCTFSTG